MYPENKIKPPKAPPFGPQVLGSDQEASRLLLCEATARVTRQVFHLLGLAPLAAFSHTPGLNRSC